MIRAAAIFLLMLIVQALWWADQHWPHSHRGTIH